MDFKWLFFALISPLFWSATNVLDGALRRRFIQNDYTITWISSILRLFFFLILTLIYGFKFPGFATAFGMLAAGILWTITFIPYLKAIECEEPSRVALLLQTMSVFSLILAYFVLGESLVIGQALAFLIILFGGALVSIKNLGGKWRLSKALWFMLAATLFWSLSDVFFKLSSYNFTSFIHAFAWFTLGGFFTAPIISLLPSTRKEIFSIKFSKIPLRGWIFEFTSALLGIAGSLSFAYALTLGKVALTSVLTQAQPLFAFLLTILLSQFLKEVEKEDLRLKSVLLKTASFAVITLGLVCLYFDEFVK